MAVVAMQRRDVAVAGPRELAAFRTGFGGALPHEDVFADGGLRGTILVSILDGTCFIRCACEEIRWLYEQRSL